MKTKRTKTEIAADRRRQILQGALKVFSTKGYLTATNKDIAVAAGINSPGLIYHYFADKAALLNAVIEENAPPIRLALNADAFMGLPAREGLTLFGNAYFEVMDDPNVSGCLRVLIGEALRSPEFAKVLGDAAPLKLVHIVAAFLERKTAEGEIACENPDWAAWMFMGGLFVHVFARNILGFAGRTTSEYAQIVAMNVAVFLDGARAKIAAPSEPTEETASETSVA
jgi:AcrR family transcriptional regulator